MTDELVRGIRRIVGDQDEKPTGLEEAEARKAIGISRGVGLVRSDGSVSGSGGEGGGNDTAPPDVPVEDPDGGADLPGDGGNAGGGNDSGNKEEVSGDVADVFDGVDSGSKVGTATGTDPDSANFTSVKSDTFAGIEYTPPDGWDSPDLSPGEEEGKSFVTGIVSFTYYANPTAMGDGILANDPFVLSVDSFSIVNDTGSVSMWGGAGNFSYDQVITYQVTIGTGPTTRTGYRINTPSGEQNEAADWPSDSTCEVVYDHEAGGYKGHERDTDCSAAQITPSNFVIIRSQSDPSRYFRYTRLADGGTKITEVDSGGVPKAGTITKILDGAGNVIGFVDVSLDNFYQ